MNRFFRWLKESCLPYEDGSLIQAKNLTLPLKINLACGEHKCAGYVNIDLFGNPDLLLDLELELLPFANGSAETVICMSAINYFTRERGSQLITEVYRVLRPGGVARFGTQDLELIAQYYVQKNDTFLFQRSADGRERFEGETRGDKFAAWFYGYSINGHQCRYFYDFDSLAFLFRRAGFSCIARKNFNDSIIPEVEKIDNRPEQMFFLEAIK